MIITLSIGVAGYGTGDESVLNGDLYKKGPTWTGDFVLMRSVLLTSGLLLCLVVLALSTAADPDPPQVDGGNVTFDGDWTVDPGDLLVYVNQTIVLNGNLTISPTGSLELVNCTLNLNGTIPPGDWPMTGIRVGWNGTLNVTDGSDVRTYHLAKFIVDAGAHLLIEDSTVANIGHTTPLENSGLYSRADDTVIRRSNILGGNRGLILDGVDGATVVDVGFLGISRSGLYLTGGSRNVTLSNLTFTYQMESISIIDCPGVNITNVTLIGSAYGIALTNASVVLRNARVIDVSADTVKYWGAGSIKWVVDGDSTLVNSTLEVNGSVDVLADGNLTIINSTISIANPSLNGVNVIRVRAGGSMAVSEGSTVMPASGGFRYTWTVESGGHLDLQNAAVMGAGWNSSFPGVVLASSDNVLNDSRFVDCFVGLTVTGKSNDANALVFERCQVGAVWRANDSALTDLVFVDCVSTGLYLEGAGNLSVSSSRFDLPLALRAVHVYDCVGVTLNGLTVNRSAGHAIDLEMSSNILVSDSTLMAGGDVVHVDGMDTGVNITLDQLTLTDVSQGLFLTTASSVVVSNLTLSATATGIHAQDIEGLTMVDCIVKGGSVRGVEVNDSRDVRFLRCQFNDTGRPLWVAGTDGLVVEQSVLTNGNEGLFLDGCNDVILMNLTSANVRRGLHLIGVSNLTADRCMVDIATTAGVKVDGGIDITLDHVTVISSPNAVMVTDGEGVAVHNLTIVNCTIGLLVTNGSVDSVLGSTTFTGVPIGVKVTVSSQLVIEDSSFIDCPVAIDGDVGSNVSFETSVDSEIVNSSCTHRGWYTVMATGTLNITGSRIHFLGWNSTHSGMKSFLGSTLRFLSGTVVEGTDVPFHVTAVGGLVVRASTIMGGGELGGKAAMGSSGAAAVIVNVTFQDCALALSLTGPDPTVQDCVFENNRQSILLDGVLRLRIIGCTFTRSNSSWDIQGNFTSNLQITDSTFEGGNTVPMSMWLESPKTMASVLTLTNLSVSNYTRWGLQDDHRGTVRMIGCVFTDANVSTGVDASDGVTVTDLLMVGSLLDIGEGGFFVNDSAFINSSFHVHANSRGSLLTACTFTGGPAPGDPTILVDGSLQVTFRELDLKDVDVGLFISGGSEVAASGITLDGAAGTAIEVDGSIVRMEGCRLGGLMGSGVQVMNVGSRLEFRNGSIQAELGRTGHDVDASNGGDAWLLNTTFDRTSVLSTGAGRVEVLWHVTVEPVLPWGGVLWDPDFLTVVDASDTEVLNISTAEGQLRLYEFSEMDGVRTMRTPHTFNVSDVQEGVRYSGDQTINASRHLVLDLIDVASPVARAGPDQVVNENMKVTLTAASSSDNDPTFRQSGSFRWSFDEYGNQMVLNGDVVSYVFSVPGKFILNLTVWDVTGNMGTDSVIIQVRDTTPPVILFTGNVTMDEDEWYIFDALGTTDNDPSFDFTTGTFLWRVLIGTDTQIWETASFGHAFANPGNYSGTLSVWDRAGNMAIEEFWVRVKDITPPVIIGVNNATVFTPSQGLLDASLCLDNVGIASYHWTVLYNNWSGDRDEHSELQGATPGYSFDRMATYNITLTISDAAGNVNMTEVWVVYDDVPTISLPPWVVSMAGERLEVPIEVFDVYFTDLGINIIDGPEGTTIDGPALDPMLVWTPGSEWAGADVSVSIEVHDGFIASQASITVHVNTARGAGNLAPFIASTPPLSAKRATPYIYTLDAEDPDGDVLGYVLLAGPAGMSISPGGTVSWDPPFETGTHLVDVHVTVTDGRDHVEQSWTIRWREPPNVAPLISFVLAPQEVRQHEQFLVDLSVFLQGPEAYDVDTDDPNHLLAWDVSFDDALLTLISVEGLVFRFQALDGKGVTGINFTATDPSGAHDTTVMDLTVKGRSSPVDDGGLGWMLWLLLALVVAMAIAGGSVAMRRRRVPSVLDETYEPDEVDLGPPPVETASEASFLEAALATEEPKDVKSFVELGGGKSVSQVAPGSVAASTGPTASRVISDASSTDERTFSVEGVAILEANGSVLASTGKVDEVLGPYQDSVEEIRKGLRGDGLAVLELDGHRILLALRSGLGALCIIRGREDDGFRAGLRDQLSNLFQDRSTEGALSVLEDILASAGSGGSAEVVRDAWTARLASDMTYQGSVVMLDIRLRNDTDHILNNVRLRLYHDEDALSVQSVTPKLLSSHGRMSLGNIPPRKEHKVAISLVPEICMSSSVRVLATYTDMEGRTIHVPSPTQTVDVECPYIEGGGEMDEEKLLSVSEKGLGFTGRRVFNYGMDVDHQELYGIAVRLVVEQGPMKVIDLDDESLMRAEAWFLGTGEGGSPQVLVRASSHGADHLLELFVTSDDGAVATGLLTHLATEVMDEAASKMPGKRVERVRDAATLEEIAIWPSLLDYKVMGE
jgi:hypothetical protein